MATIDEHGAAKWPETRYCNRGFGVLTRYCQNTGRCWGGCYFGAEAVSRPGVPGPGMIGPVRQAYQGPVYPWDAERALKETACFAAGFASVRRHWLHLYAPRALSGLVFAALLAPLSWGAPEEARHPRT